MSTVLDIKDVHFAYQKQEILCSINLSIGAGDFCALVGNNGSGKTTLMRLILGFLTPQMGSVNVHVDSLGYVPQTGLVSSSMFPASVYEVVAFRYKGCHLYNLRSKTVYNKVFHVLKKVDMEHTIDQPISMLSGGQLQRVLIARELINNPNLLLLDEPTNGLDTHSITALFDILSNLNHEGMTIILVNHNHDEIKDRVTRVFHLQDHHLKEVTR